MVCRNIELLTVCRLRRNTRYFRLYLLQNSAQLSLNLFLRHIIRFLRLSLAFFRRIFKRLPTNLVEILNEKLKSYCNLSLEPSITRSDRQALRCWFHHFFETSRASEHSPHSCIPQQRLKLKKITFQLQRQKIPAVFYDLKSLKIDGTPCIASIRMNLKGSRQKNVFYRQL